MYTLKNRILEFIFRDLFNTMENYLNQKGKVTKQG
jgi:hypothetical protein